MQGIREREENSQSIFETEILIVDKRTLHYVIERNKVYLHPLIALLYKYINRGLLNNNVIRQSAAFSFYRARSADFGIENYG